MRTLSLGQIIGLALVVPVIALSLWATWRGFKANESKSGWQPHDPWQPPTDRD